MKIKERWGYLKTILEISNRWLHRPEAERELAYLLSRVPSRVYIDKLMFGYFPPTQTSFIEFMDEFGIITKEDPNPIFEELNIVYPYYSKKKSFFHNNTLLIPFFDVYGNVLSMSGRTMLSEDEMKEKKVSKYKHLSFEKRYHLFGLDRSCRNIVEEDRVVIVEGQFDCYSTYFAGIKNVVGLCGSKLTPQQILLLKRFTNNFCLILDTDEAGIEGYTKAKKQAKKYKFSIEGLTVPNGKDIDDFAKDSNWNISTYDLKRLDDVI